MGKINIDQDAVSSHSTNISNIAGNLSSFSHALCVDGRSTITANANGQEVFVETLKIIRSLGEALNNSATQIVTIAQGFEDIDQSTANTAFSV